jgi:uncharacterized membrane-anchored protein
MKAAIITAIAVPLIVLSVWWEYSLWSECRADHSFFYCMRVLNK